MMKIIEILESIENEGYEAYLVGGFVRDMFLNIKNYDIDICTNAHKKVLEKLFPDIQYKGLYCYRLVRDIFNIEITIFRIEISYDGRKPTIIRYTKYLREDLKRRDFTMNAICLDKNNKVIDLYNGLVDLKNKNIKCIGNSDKKIQEDALRILRAIRFATVLNFTLDSSLEKAIYKYGSNITQLSSFRKREELDKILKSKNFQYGLHLLKKFNLDKYLIIESPIKIHYCDDVIGMYLQMSVRIDNFFNKKEQKRINYLKNYLYKNLDNYDLFVLGKDNVKMISQILDKNYISSYNKLILKKDSDLNVNYSYLQILAKNKNIKFKNLKKEIIYCILNDKINNNFEDIINYINNNY